MELLRQRWKRILFSALSSLAREKGIGNLSVTEDELVVETPPKPEMGDLGFPLFPYAKIFRIPPQRIAAELAGILAHDSEAASLAEITAEGSYCNIRLNLKTLAEETVAAILREGDKYGTSSTMAGRKIMVEFSCPNTNKPLHLGHLRNDAIGESVARICAANGAEVRKVNLINDRGIHICKSMLAYQEFAGGATPESEGIKSDHFVGDYYVKYDKWAKGDPRVEERAREMLRAWEKGDPEVRSLWERMNRWAIDGINETYRKTGVSFDAVYHESKTYTRGREEILKGLAKGVFYRETDGSIWVDLAEINLDKKVLLRKDGTSLYLTQDIGTAIARHEDWPFDRLIYVVASEQQYHFKVLFHVLAKLGFAWAADLYHLSYGMVNLPEGKMKSREGTVVDADDLIDELTAMAKREIAEKGREGEIEDVERTAFSVALGALHYFLLQADPAKDIIFNPKESLSFNGNTGPYLQYMGARISSMLRKYEERKNASTAGKFDGGLISTPEERELVKALLSFPDVVREAGKGLDPSAVTSYLFELSKVYSRFYHDSPILHAEDPDRVVTRVALSRAVLQVLRNAFALVGIPFLEKM
jgi:arginyl-tRNA synthetase